MDNEKRFNVRAIANRLGLLDQTIFRMVRKGTFPTQDSTSDNGQFWWDKSTVDYWELKHPEWITPLHEFDCSAERVCELLDIARPTLYRQVKKGLLPEPGVVRRSDRNGKLYGGLMKVWNYEEIIGIRDARLKAAA